MSLWSTDQMLKENGLWWKSIDHTIRQSADDTIVGHTHSEGGVPVVRLSTDKEYSMAAILISENLLHRRLAHIGLKKTTDIAKKTGEYQLIMDVDNNCKSCRISKSKTQISRNPMP